MSIVDEVIKKTEIGAEQAIVPAGSSARDIEVFKTVLAEAQRLQQAGVIRIVEDGPARVAFERLK